MDIDISGLEVNQCDAPVQNRDEDGLEATPGNQIAFFKGTHKCHTDTTQVNVVNMLRDLLLSRTGNGKKKSENSRFWFSACIRGPAAE